MGTDFFDELGETLSRTAREFGERAGSLYETQKLRTKIAGEEHAVNKAMAELGKTLYRAYRNGQELTEEQNGWCEQIDQHKEIISRYKAEMAGKKGKKICPSCGEAVDLSVSFCPYCGAACVPQEPAQESDSVGEAAEDIYEEVCEEPETEDIVTEETGESETDQLKVDSVEVEVTETEADLSEEEAPGFQEEVSRDSEQ